MQIEEGKYYHVYNRGNNREVIFKEERNFYYFLRLWKKHITPVADTFAYCLLPNHFHFAIRMKCNTGKSPQQISRCFANMFGAYAKGINKQYGRLGSLFQKNFRRKEIESDFYLSQLILYIHTNAQKHEMVSSFQEYRHSSYASILSERSTALMRDEVLQLYGGRQPYLMAHEAYQEQYKDLIHLLDDVSDDERYRME